MGGKRLNAAKRPSTGFPAMRQEAAKRLARASALGALLVAAVATPARAAPAPPSFFAPAPDAHVNTPVVRVAGTVDGDTVLVRLLEGATILAETGPYNGYWHADVGLADGPHTVTARARDGSGTWSALSAPLTFTVDTGIPAAPVITSPPDGATLAFSSVTVEGTAEPGARVEVEVSTGGTLVATADGGGAWMVMRAFTDTSHTLVARAFDAAGNRSLPSAPVTFRVDTRPPPTPAIYTPGAGSFSKTTAVRITGSAEPGSTVQVYEGLTIVMTTTATDGTWSGSPTFSAGAHTISARAFDPAGHPSPISAGVTFTVDLVAPPAPVIATPREGEFVPHQYTVSGTAEPHATVELLQDVEVVATAQADASGRWAVARASYSGGQLLKARARDRAGNVGPLSAPRTFTVDATPPPPPEVLTSTYTIFLPTQFPRIEGIARDDIGVLAVTAEFYDVTGKAFPPHNANCFVCPGTRVEWETTWAPPPGAHVVKLYAVDRAGNRSFPTEITIVRL